LSIMLIKRFCPALLSQWFPRCPRPAVWWSDNMTVPSINSLFWIISLAMSLVEWQDGRKIRFLPT
jgi:hypothetical protein